MDTLARLRTLCDGRRPEEWAWQPFVLREKPRVIAATDGRSFAARECEGKAEKRRPRWPDFQKHAEEWQPVRWRRIPRAELTRLCGTRSVSAPITLLRVGGYTFNARRVARALWAVGGGAVVEFGIGKRWTAPDANHGNVSLYLRGPGWGVMVAEFLPTTDYPVVEVPRA